MDKKEFVIVSLVALLVIFSFLFFISSNNYKEKLIGQEAELIEKHQAIIDGQGAELIEKHQAIVVEECRVFWCNEIGCEIEDGIDMREIQRDICAERFPITLFQ